jgi:CNT family concentrative nucleoside transporter
VTIYNLVSAGGFVILLALCWALSSARGRVNWKTVLVGAGLMVVLALVVFIFPPGRRALWVVNQAVVALIGYSQSGIAFLFGPLAKGPGEPGSIGFILAIQSMPTIVFFMALMALLYYLKIMPLVVKGFAWLFMRLLGTSGAESLAASSSIFVGIETTGAIRPFMAGLTRSELMTLMTTLMATVAASTLAIYVGFLHAQFPQIAGHLVSASVLSAPAAIVVSKLLVPETGSPVTLGRIDKIETPTEGGLMGAIIAGANDGVRLVVGIVALLLAFLGLLALVNGILGLIGKIFPASWGLANLSLQSILQWIFWPFAVLMGVPLHDGPSVARLLGERVILTEVVAYQHLAVAVKQKVITDPRSLVIASYALCGFTHVASMAIFVGGISALIPDRAREVARLGFRALLGAILATLLTGCLAGMFYTGESILFGR